MQTPDLGGIPWRHNHLDGEQKLVRGDNVIKTVTHVGGESFGLHLSDMILCVLA